MLPAIAACTMRLYRKAADAGLIRDILHRGEIRVDQPILIMKDIAKEFPGVKALSGVDFELYPGEVHALMGENGAGKSTLMKILSGFYAPTAGDMWIRGEKVRFNNPLQAQQKGISIIHQEFNLFPNLSAAENIFIDRAAYTTRFGRIRWSDLYKDAEKLIRSLGAEFDVRQEVQHLSVHSQQVLEIIKAISFNADILIMDEPSAALPENEVQKMFNVVRELKRQGVAIVYVSHRMKEIFQVADKVTVLRDGRKVETKPIGETSESEIIRMMVGKEVGNLYQKEGRKSEGEIVLRVKELELNRAHAVSFELHKGEIGLFGLMGSGTHTVAERLFGLKSGAGVIEIEGDAAQIRSPREAMRHGIAYVPPDRHRQGLIKQMSVVQNLSMAVLPRITKRYRIDKKQELELARHYKERMNIKTPSETQLVERLSGGNQQKIVLAKWLATAPRVLILEEPTRGVDVGAKQEIYRLINEMSESGYSIILISSEMPEVIGMSDRILVMHNGELVAQFHNGEADQSRLLHAASYPKGVPS